MTQHCIHRKVIFIDVHIPNVYLATEKVGHGWTRADITTSSAMATETTTQSHHQGLPQQQHQPHHGWADAAAAAEDGRPPTDLSSIPGMR